MKQASKVAVPAELSEPKELLGHVRAGRLYDIERWILDGRPLELPVGRNGRKKSLLQAAAETGFHSLVELVVKHESSQESKDAALNEALSQKRLDLIELLVANGARPAAVPFADVLLIWEPKIIEYFITHGADLVRESPFAEAFGAKVRTALRPFKECNRDHPELAEALQEQVDCALRYFCAKADLLWVNLLIWAGGNVRSKGPCWSVDYTNDPECHTTGLSEACYSGNVDLMKKLKPDPMKDDMADLLHSAAMANKREALKFLLESGAAPNNKPNGGSAALDTALWHLDTARIFGDRYGSRYGASEALGCVEELLAHGAVWDPETYRVNGLRKDLLAHHPSVTIDLLRLFRKHSACPAALIHKLIGTPKMKGHLKSESWQLNRLGLTIGNPP
jgi:hypothetical protein